jgi:hypothetical protein
VVLPFPYRATRAYLSVPDEVQVPRWCLSQPCTPRVSTGESSTSSPHVMSFQLPSRCFCTHFLDVCLGVQPQATMCLCGYKCS